MTEKSVTFHKTLTPQEGQCIQKTTCILKAGDPQSMGKTPYNPHVSSQMHTQHPRSGARRCLLVTVTAPAERLFGATRQRHKIEAAFKFNLRVRPPLPRLAGWLSAVDRRAAFKGVAAACALCPAPPGSVPRTTFLRRAAALAS